MLADRLDRVVALMCSRRLPVVTGPPCQHENRIGPTLSTSNEARLFCPGFPDGGFPSDARDFPTDQLFSASAAR